ERVVEFLDADEQRPDPVASDDPPPVRGRVEFRDVTFSYDPEVPLIESLSLVAEPGQTVAIVGPTGAGKTTLVNLIMRFYELNDGVITLDGRDISSIPRHELRSKIGMVLQDTWLFGGPIHDNIPYRLSPSRGADVILVMENGRIVEQGSHRDLLSHDGPYSRLYNSQFVAPVVDVV